MSFKLVMQNYYLNDCELISYLGVLYSNLKKKFVELYNHLIHFFWVTLLKPFILGKT
jgi:hypothetical protein